MGSSSPVEAPTPPAATRAAPPLSIAGVDPERNFAGGETQVLGLTLGDAAGLWGFLHIPAKRFNPGSRRQSGFGSDPDFSQFPQDFVHIHRLWLFTEFVASV